MTTDTTEPVVAATTATPALRPYQSRAVTAALAEIGTLTNPGPRKSTLVIAPTASGKSWMMTLAHKGYGPTSRALFLQHRDELVAQNHAAHERLWPECKRYVFDAETKELPGRGVTGAGNESAHTTTTHPTATFAMDKSLAAYLSTCPDADLPHFDLIVMDETERAITPTWRAILGRFPTARRVGFTATPERGDGKSLSPVFDSVADQIMIHEVLELGSVVPPRALVADVDLQLAEQLAAVARTNNGRGDYDEESVAALLGQARVLERVIDLWAEATARGGASDEASATPAPTNRKTIFFTSTVQMARDLTARLTARGYAPGLITDGTSRAKRREIVRTSAHLVNCMTLTAGFDDPEIECVVLLRRSAFRGLVIQMIGRGMRLCPALNKTECLVLDFGLSLNSLGGIDRVFGLTPESRAPRTPGPAPMKPCASQKCRRAIPVWARVCPLCGYAYPVRASEAPSLLDPASIRLRPFEIAMRDSEWVWVDVTPKGKPAGSLLCASSDKVWAIVIGPSSGESAHPHTWRAYGCAPRLVEFNDGRVAEDKAARLLVTGDRSEALCAADAFMHAHGKVSEHGRAAWGFHRVPATPRQVALCERLGLGLGRAPRLYEAQCRITARLAMESRARRAAA